MLGETDSAESGGDSSVTQRLLLNDGALIVIDNTLWKGLVLTQVRNG